VLTIGALGRAFDRDRRFPIGELMQQHVIINLEHIRDQQTKSFLMGVVLLRVRAALRGASSDLRHIVVVEEAHRLASSAPRRSGADDQAAGQPVADMFGDLLSEIRAAGQGVIMVDQRPSALIPEAIANPATLVSLGLPHRDDQVALSAGIGLDTSAPGGFGALRRHEALVKTRGMDRPALVRLDHRFGSAPQPRDEAALTSAPVRVRPTREVIAAVNALLLGEGGQPERLNRVRSVVAAQFPGVPANEREAAIVRIAERAVHDLCRRRGIPDDVERAILAAASNGFTGDLGLRAALLDGRRPYAGCSFVCPSGGCLVGELVEPLAPSLASDAGGALSAMSDLATLEVRARRVAQDVVGATDAEVFGLAQRCAVVSCFDRYLPETELGGLIRQIELRQSEVLRDAAL
jgi:hypothetical protein